MSVLQLYLKRGFKLGMSLGLGVSSILPATTALAAPAPIFEPILDDITPTNFRLPTDVPTDMELYPSIQPGGSILFLNTEPGCENIECTALVVAREPEAPPLWPFIGVNPFKSFDLGDGVRAHFWERDGMASLQWIQGDAFYVLTYRQSIFSEAAAIAMATSMATEPPFTP
ncbi:MAG: hypothetical protein F6K42_26920 [Leptolyngbya sp. SIO1D8]|nr:hypothetical protein [Leptolyngbya sp. SIO1D8]